MQFRRDLGKAQAHLFSVWKILFQDKKLPLKQAIGIRDLKQYAASYAIIHYDEQKVVSFLHSGTQFDDLWERNIAGARIAELCPPETRDLLDWFFRGMLEQPCGGHSEEMFVKKTGDRYLMDLLYLPIRKRSGATALAVIADIKTLGITDYVHLHADAKTPGQHMHYADFIDVGFGVPPETFEG